VSSTPAWMSASAPGSRAASGTGRWAEARKTTGWGKGRVCGPRLHARRGVHASGVARARRPAPARSMGAADPGGSPRRPPGRGGDRRRSPDPGGGRSPPHAGGRVDPHGPDRLGSARGVGQAADARLSGERRLWADAAGAPAATAARPAWAPAAATARRVHPGGPPAGVEHAAGPGARGAGGPGDAPGAAAGPSPPRPAISSRSAGCAPRPGAGPALGVGVRGATSPPPCPHRQTPGGRLGWRWPCGRKVAHGWLTRGGWRRHTRGACLPTAPPTPTPRTTIEAPRGQRRQGRARWRDRDAEARLEQPAFEPRITRLRQRIAQVEAQRPLSEFQSGTSSPIDNHLDRSHNRVTLTRQGQHACLHQRPVVLGCKHCSLQQHVAP
jgi:hypothetical protein